MLQNITKSFASTASAWLRDESGNVTIDWTVLLGGLVGLALTVLALIGGSVVAFSERADVELSAREVTIY